MAEGYGVGDLIQGTYTSYKIEAELHRSSVSIAYAALDSNTQNKVFLKKYISPRSDLDWYPDWLEYQKEKAQRIKYIDLRVNTLGLLDYFEVEHRSTSLLNAESIKSFHCVFEFIDNSTNLRTHLQSNPTWEERALDALVFITLLDNIHTDKIVHADLKPENIFIQSVEVGGKIVPQLKLVGIDYSLLSDRPPPWGDKNGYGGGLGYQSPEHIAGEIPCEASDVFTAGLIIFEILTGQNPKSEAGGQIFPADQLPTPVFLGEIEKHQRKHLSQLMRQMLHPEPSRRPSLTKVKEVMYFALSTSFMAKKNLHDILNIKEPNGEIIRVRSELIVNQAFVEDYIGFEAKYFNPFVQFKLVKQKDNWWVVPNNRAENGVALNGEYIDRPMVICSGDNVCLISRETARKTAKWHIL